MRSLNLFLLFFFLFALNSYSLPKCKGESIYWKKNHTSGCHGTWKYPWGSKYVGEWYAQGGWGRDGKGTYFHTNGDKYVSEWRDNLKYGKGTYTFGNGDKFVGEWYEEGTTHEDSEYTNKGDWSLEIGKGKGIYIWKNGDRYEGKFVDAKMDGKGTMTYADGRVFKGKWRFGDPFRGKMTYPDGTIQKWKYGKPVD